MNLETAANETLKKFLDSGAMTELLEKQIAHTCQRIVADTFGDYSPFCQNLKKSLQDALKINTDDLNLDGYNKVVLEVVRQKLGKMIDEAAAKRLGGEMEKMLQAAPAEILLSTLAKNFKQWVRRDRVGSYDRKPNEYRVSVIVGELEYGSRRVYFNPKPADKYACDLSVWIGEDGVVNGISVRGQDTKHTMFYGGSFGFERDLFQLYAAGSKLIIDDISGWDPTLNDDDESGDD